MDERIVKWMRHKAQLDTFRKREHESRLAVIHGIFEPAGLLKAEGTSHYEEDGLLLKATFRLNYKVSDEEKLAIFLRSLPTWQRAQLIKYTPTVMLTGYRRLEDKQIRQLNRCLDITSGIPGLSAESK